MIKHILMLAASTLLSANALAGYVQYDLSGPVYGYFIQHEGDGSIAYFDIGIPYGEWNERTTWLTPQESEGRTSINRATTYFGPQGDRNFRKNGPTNFSIGSDFGGDQFTNFAIDFSSGRNGIFSYRVRFDTSIYECRSSECDFYDYDGLYRGVASVGTVDPELAAHLDWLGGYYEGVGGYAPSWVRSTGIPEPASLALMSLGVAGLALSRRARRQNRA